MHTVQLRRASLLAVVLIAASLAPTLSRSQPFHTFLDQKNFVVQARASLDARWQKLPLAVRSLSYIERFTPFYSWIVLCNATPLFSNFPLFDRFLLGDCLEKQRLILYSQTDDDFVAHISVALERLWVHNPLDAIKFADAIGGTTGYDIQANNAWSLFQLIVVPLILVLLIRAAIRTIYLKSAFFASFCVWLIGTVLIRALIINDSGQQLFLLNFSSLYLLLLETLTIVLGGILFCRWLWTKRKQALVLSDNRLWQPLKRVFLSAEWLHEHKPRHKNDLAARWNALLRYDDEIRGAAEKLRPFGDLWVDQLAKAYFDLNEDRRYLPNIVARLMEEAKQGS
jgi:hypothetical protein